MSQSFLDIPLEKKSYVVAVMEESKIVECSFPVPFFNEAGVKIGTLKCESETGEDIYTCACCGRYACEDHFSSTSIHGHDVCITCAKLPKGIMEAIITFREELNS